MDACSFWSNTHQVTKTEEAPWYQALSWRPFALCATSAFRLTTVLSKRRLVALSRCPDADGILPAVSDKVEWHESLERIQSRRSGVSLSERWIRLKNSQAKTDTRVPPTYHPFYIAGLGFAQFFPYAQGLLH